MAPGTLVVRADSSIAMGTGHVMRCLALAQAWQDAGGHVVFVTNDLSSAREQRLLAEQVEVVKFNGPPGGAQDASQLEKLSCAHHADWVVVDGYQFDAEYQRKVKDAGLKLLFIDDNGHATHYLADLVLNENSMPAKIFISLGRPKPGCCLVHDLPSCDMSSGTGGSASEKWLHLRARCWSPWAAVIQRTLLRM